MKKISRWRNPTAIMGFVACLGVIGTVIVKSAIYITLPDRVQAAEEKVNNIEDYIKEQKIANDLLQKIVTKSEEEDDEIIISPDGKKYFDKETKTWKPIQK